MKRFTYRFETLLKLREQEEDQARKRLALALQNAAEAREHHARAQAERRQLEKAWAEALTRPGLTPDVNGCFELYRDSIELQIVDLAKAEATAVLESAKARTAVSEAHRKTEILLKLRDRKASKHKLDVLKQEQEQFDETAVLRFAAAGGQ